MNALAVVACLPAPRAGASVPVFFSSFFVGGLHYFIVTKIWSSNKLMRTYM
jgi:hypothetical protein